MTSPIVCTGDPDGAQRHAPYASVSCVRAKLRWPLSLGKCCRDYLILYVCSLHVLLMKTMRLAKRHRNLTLAFYERRDFASQPPRTVELLYYRRAGMSRRIQAERASCVHMCQHFERTVVTLTTTLVEWKKKQFSLPPTTTAPLKTR